MYNTKYSKNVEPNLCVNYFGSVSYFHTVNNFEISGLTREFQQFLGFEENEINEKTSESENKFVPNFVNYFGAFPNFLSDCCVVDSFNINKDFVFGFNPERISAP